MSGQQKFYITTAISYQNGPPHIGHAYEDKETDALARFRRLDGDAALREACRARGLARAARFSWTAAAERLLGVYERVGDTRLAERP